MRISEIRFNGAVCGQFVFEFDCSAITFHCPGALNLFVCPMFIQASCTQMRFNVQCVATVLNQTNGFLLIINNNLKHVTTCRLYKNIRRL